MPIERRIVQTGKDRDGDITALCNSGEHWSPRPKSKAIQDIESGIYQYYVLLKNGERAIVGVVNGSSGKYLRTNWDGTKRNNLDDLPDCTS